jgi:hypothetical protein
MRDGALLAARSARGCGAGALGFSITCGCGRATRGAADFAIGAVLGAGPDLPDKAEAGLLDAAVAGLGAGALDLAAIGAAGRGLVTAAVGRAAGGGAWR